MFKKIAVASGKGGTGKTFVATNLAVSLSRQHIKTRLLDCDVEAPNSNLFIHAEWTNSEPVNILVPQVDQDKCNLCGNCHKVCEFNAIGVFGSSVLVFNELCHGCGGCRLACPENAIREVDYPTGVCHYGFAKDLNIVSGELNIGEAKAPPVIAAVKKHIAADEIAIIDAPPGTSCPVVETVRDVDYVILVTEPTPFGYNDLKLSVNLLRKLEKRFGVIINRSTLGDDRVEEFCLEHEIDILAKIPYSRTIAQAYATGKLVIEMDEFKNTFTDIYQAIETRI
ncbi:MAG: ATP-binding protein [candidate division KSB1 bacterium]|nr:ATP-binding protein [candidate division KSB1 bacterium]